MLQKLVKIIKESNLYEDDLVDLISYFKEFIKDKEILDFLIKELWEDENVDVEIKALFVWILELCDNQKVTNIIFEAFNKGIYYAEDYFIYVKRYDNEYIDKFIKLLANENFYEDNDRLVDIAQNFSIISSKNFYAHNQLILLSEKELTENVRVEYSLFLDFYLWNLKTSVLFQDYDEKLSTYDGLFEHITYNNKVLFIEDKKLCTMEDGKKISTERDVDNEFLEELQEFITVPLLMDIN